jgi:hypothetical protein
MNALLHVIKNRQEAKDEARSEEAVGRAESQAARVLDVPAEATAVVDAEENCPVIRANQVFLSAANSGRLRVVFF